MFLNNEGHDCLKRFVLYQWTFPVLSYDFSFTPEQERNVLLDLYTSTNGQQWYESGGGTAQIPTALGMVSPVTTIHM